MEGADLCCRDANTVVSRSLPAALGVLDDSLHHGAPAIRGGVGLGDAAAVERGLRVVLDHQLRGFASQCQADQPELAQTTPNNNPAA